MKQVTQLFLTKEFRARLARELRTFNADEVWVACSGGLDSVVLLHALNSFLNHRSNPNRIILGLIHVHHGRSDCSPEQLRFRDESARFVKSLASKLGLRFESNLIATSNPNQVAQNSSEAELRRVRKSFLDEYLHKNPRRVLAVAHHFDDQIETQWINLIRGSGVDGLAGMHRIRGQIWRPLLGIRRRELERYAQTNSLEFIEDPSNGDIRYLRNWLRKIWLPQLEEKRPGALVTVARSLSTISESRRDKIKIQNKTSLDRKIFSKLSGEEKSAHLHAFLKQKIHAGLRKSQVQELIKRLDTPRKEFTFTLGGLRWLVNAEQILVEKTRNSRPRPLSLP